MRRERGCKRDGREKKERDDDDVFCRVKERVEKDGRPREEEKRGRRGYLYSERGARQGMRKKGGRERKVSVDTAPRTSMLA